MPLDHTTRPCRYCYLTMLKLPYSSVLKYSWFLLIVFQVNSTLYISGQIGFNPSTMEIVSGGVVAEAKQALTNMGHILDAANCTFNNVVKTTVLLADMNDFAAVNDVYTKFFTANYPARAAYQVRDEQL